MPDPDFGIIELDYTDSTNNYAMQLINDDKAYPGLTVIAGSQTNGKGQRGKNWLDEPGNSLLMSIITSPKQAIWEQFPFSASVAVAIANVLQKLMPRTSVKIKWPNDIIINDKKAGGILIENILHGSRWTYSIIGLGLNVRQDALPMLPNGISLKMACGKETNMHLLRNEIRDQVMNTVLFPMSSTLIMQEYNGLLYRKGMYQKFSDFNGTWFAEILHTRTDGAIEVLLENGNTVFYHHGQVKWEWE